jgi:hypothetical protein
MPFEKVIAASSLPKYLDSVPLCSEVFVKLPWHGERQLQATRKA